MPRYYFHINHPGSALIRDDEGQVFEDLASARREAMASVNDLAREARKRGDSVKGLLIQIADQEGVVLESVHAPEKLH
jgi:cytidylate kinase